MTNANTVATFSPDVLRLDAAAEAERICESIRETVLGRLRRRGVVVGVSGGIDSSVVAGLCARALGGDRVLALFMPERDSSPESLQLGRLLTETFEIESVVEDIAPALDAAGCYRRRDDAIREVFPEYGEGWKSKIVLPSILDGPSYRIFSCVVQTPQGETLSRRMPVGPYQQVVAATNFKQRVRKMMEYYHADRLRFAVAGTPNLQEYDLGFFVKLGDGAADVKPIAHLYKTQVYQLAEYLGVPEEIRTRPPTTDTYSLAQSQEEFFFSVPYPVMDLCLFGKNHGVPAEQVAECVDITPEQVQAVYDDIGAKRKAAYYLHEVPLLVK